MALALRTRFLALFVTLTLLGIVPAGDARAQIMAPADGPGPSAPTGTEAPPRLFFYGLKAASGVSDEEIAGLSRLCASELDALHVYRIIGDEDVASMLGLEARKQLMGCETDSSCLAEIAGSLGASRIVYGDVSRLGRSLLLNLSLLDAHTAVSIGRTSHQIQNADTLEPLLVVMGEAVRELVASDPVAEKRGLGPGALRRNATTPPAPASFPFLQARLLVEIGIASTQHQGTDPDAQAYSEAFQQITAYPALGAALRVGRLDLSLTTGWAKGYWVESSTPYPIKNRPLQLWIDAAVVAIRTPHLALLLGAGGVFGLGKGFRLWAQNAWTVWQGPALAFDLTLRLAFETQFFPRDLSPWEPFGVAIAGTVGGSFRFAL